MKEKSIYIKLIQFLIVIPMYYIYKENSLFLYVLTLSMYNIYSSCFSQITLKNTFNKFKKDYSKFKILKLTTISIAAISLIFIILSIITGNIMGIILNLDKVFLPCLVMGISILSEPLTKIVIEYLESYNKPKLANSLINLYHILETTFFLLISILTIIIFKLPINIAISLLYFSKIISSLVIIAITYTKIKKRMLQFVKTQEENNINYKQEVREVLTQNTHISIIKIVQNSYYYISIIVLYKILTTRYSYNINEIETDLTFIYFYGLNLINFVLDVTLIIIKRLENRLNPISYICKVLENVLTLSIILGVLSPLICKIIFSSSNNSIYLMMLTSLAVFISLFESTFESIKNKKIIYISLIAGIISKAILIVPLINAFYRMGYNLIYGDIISTITGMLISTIINYIYIKNNYKKEKTLDKILTTLYESIILCIILIITQFIIPIKTDNYIYSIFLLTIYLILSIFILKMKKKRRG